jgi:hypothetical protein
MTAAAQTANNSLQPRSRPTAQNKLALIDAAFVCHHLADLADLTQADKTILCGLIRHIDQAALDAGRTTVFPSTLCLSLDTGYTPRQVGRSIARLEARGLIRRYTPPRWRTAHTDFSGFCALAADALEAHADEKDRQLQAARRGPIAVLVEADTESGQEDTESGLTETDNEPAIHVEQSDATRGQFRRRPDKPAAARRNSSPPTTIPTNGEALCSPGGAGFSADADPASSTPAERVRAALVTAWDASPTLRRLVDHDQLLTLSLDDLEVIVIRDYLSTVTKIRNPHHIWSWAVNRHGTSNAILGWLIACDTPAAAGGPERNPGGWFTKFATAERPWDLSRNLRQLAKASARPAASPDAEAYPVEKAEPDAAEGEPAELAEGQAGEILAAYRAAWIRVAVQLLGRERGPAAWNSWFDAASVSSVESRRLTIQIKTKLAESEIAKRYGEICSAAAMAIGYDGVDFNVGRAM